jgi:hypothetical protein
MEQLSRRDEADLATVADGSNTDPRVAARIAASPRLQALLAEQQRALTLLEAARPQAPQRLRETLAARPRPTRRRTYSGLSLGLATAGVIALAIVALLPGATTPSIAQAAALAVRGPNQPAPAHDAAHPGAIRQAVDGVRYPYWEDTFGWRASGQRTDRLDGHNVTTVYYVGGRGAVVGYGIVSGSALPQAAASTSQMIGATRFWSLTKGGLEIVTWRRAGHTCVISARGVPLQTLLKLASWRDGGSLTF